MELVNKNATKETKELISYLYSIKGKKTIAGQHDFITSETKYCDKVTELTGKTPLIWGTDFSFAYNGKHPSKIQHCGPMNLPEPGDFDKSKTGPLTDEEIEFKNVTPDEMRQKLVETIISQHKKGHIITLMWHHPKPECGDYCKHSDLWSFSKNISDEWWNELISEGTELHSAWEKQVDTIVPYLKQLQDAKVPVLWRPYHELNGIWFWWCNRAGENGIQKLWKMLYNRLTNYHNINNLIWVWNTNAPRDKKDDEAFPYEWFYPGKDYVDILAADIYGDGVGKGGDYRQSHHDDLLKLADGKPIAIGEMAWLPKPNILDEQPEWLWIMPWGNLLFEGRFQKGNLTFN